MSEFFYKPLHFKNVADITMRLRQLIGPIDSREKLHTKKYSHSELKEAVPDLLDQFDAFGCTLDVARHFAMSPNTIHDIHKDGSAMYPKKFAINWPIDNCANTYMYWWEFSSEPELFEARWDSTTGEYSENKLVRYFKSKNGTKVQKLELTGPMLCNIEKYHSIENLQPVTRSLFSFRFFNDLSFLI